MMEVKKHTLMQAVKVNGHNYVPFGKLAEVVEDDRTVTTYDSNNEVVEQKIKKILRLVSEEGNEAQERSTGSKGIGFRI